MNRSFLIRFFGNVFGIILSILIFFLTIFLCYRFTVSAFNYGVLMTDDQAEKEVIEAEVTIPDGATIDDVGKILREKGIIMNGFVFKMESMLKRNAYDFEGGTFTVNSGMDSNELMAMLRRTKNADNELKITIREGFSIKDIANYLEEEGSVKAADFIETCKTGSFDYYFLKDLPARENMLEGYLFPDTYFIYKTSTSEEIIKKMLDRFEEIFNEEYKMRTQEMGLTMDEVITIASIIEEEVSRDEERAKVSAIIQNRLSQNANLNMSSTVVYVLNKRRDRLSDQDLKTDSPYNTYVHGGLPVGPITNPGEACIKAALYPEESDLLYFVLKDSKSDEHIFTNNKEEYLAAKEEYGQNY